MNKWTLGIFLSFSIFLNCHAQDLYEGEAEQREDMEREMMDQTRKAIMSYEIVEERAEEILEKIQKSAFGKYAEKAAAVIPFVTGKLEFRWKRLDISYSHFSEKAKVDFNLDKKWKLFYDHRESSDGGPDDRSGLKYSRRF